MEKKTQPSIPLSHNAAFFATSSVPPPDAETPPASATTAASPWNGIRWDLGLRSLLPVWKKFGQKKWLVEDFSAGLALSFVAVPLSLAISVASGVSPGVGLVTAIVGGVLGGAFGGTTLAVTGPAAAMSVLVATTIANYGMGGLIFITMVTGLLQILTGVFQIGNLVRIIPQSVVAGFSAGVGGLIFLGQLPRVLGLPPVSSEATALESLFHILHFLPQAQLAPVVLALVAMGISMVLPKFTNRVPGLVVGVAAAALINSFFGLGQPVLGTIDASFPLPSFPSMPQVNDWMALIGTSAAIYGLASLESLLSSSVIDKLCKDPDVPKHDPNQELIGQGMANVGSSLVGGMPVTSVIARSALNVTTGGKTRRSAIIHAILIFGFVSFFSDVLAAIPMAALSGVLLTVAFRLLHPREAIHIYHVSKKKMVPFLVTFVVTLAKNLIVGVECGVVAAVAMSLMQGRPRFLSFNQSRREGTEVFQLQGDLTFLSAIRFQAFEDRVFSLFASLPSPSPSPSSSTNERVIEVDLSQVRLIDLTGAELFIEFLRKLLGKNIPGKNVLLTGLSPSLQTTLKNSTSEAPLLFVLNNTNTTTTNA